MPKTYDVNVSRDGKWLMVEIPEIDAVTQARFVGEVELMARDCIAVMLDLPVTEVAVNWNGKIGVAR